MDRLAQLVDAADKIAEPRVQARFEDLIDGGVAHIVRLVVGPDQRRMAPLAMLVGAIILLVADTPARTVAIPAEIPVGIFTALLGAPFFLVLLTSVRKGG